MMVVLAVLFKRTNLNQLADVAVSRPQGELAKDGREPPASRQMLKKSSFGKTSQENTKGNCFLVSKETSTRRRFQRCAC
ncbi:hypothetical protein Hanom_Chr06g00514191 [Helianthus anomalus]